MSYLQGTHKTLRACAFQTHRPKYGTVTPPVVFQETDIYETGVIQVKAVADELLAGYRLRVFIPRASTLKVHRQKYVCSDSPGRFPGDRHL